MITIITTLLGIFGSAIPNIFKIFEQSRADKQELELMKLQLEREKAGYQQQLDITNTQGDIQAAIAAYEFAKRQTTGVLWVDATLEFISGTVRPFVTYSLTGLYIASKVAAYHLLSNSGADWASAVVALWTEQDMMILSTILGFWFGSRAMQRFMK
ncbi:MAG: hypothetical protein EBR82_46445 [Caulobacteraceae bacterium]|nr:hypothetical protein [Caulobacteraceae bacterium]